MLKLNSTVVMETIHLMILVIAARKKALPLQVNQKKDQMAQMVKVVKEQMKEEKAKAKVLLKKDTESNTDTDHTGVAEIARQTKPRFIQLILMLWETQIIIVMVIMVDIVVVDIMVEATTPNLSKGVMKKVVIVPCTSIRQVPLPHQEAEQVQQELLKAGMPHNSFKLKSLGVIKAQKQIKGRRQSPKQR